MWKHFFMTTFFEMQITVETHENGQFRFKKALCAKIIVSLPMWQCWFKSECQVDVTGNIYTLGHYHKLRDNHHNKFIFTDFLGCLLAMKLDGAHCDTTTAPSDLIGVSTEPAWHEDQAEIIK